MSTIESLLNANREKTRQQYNDDITNEREVKIYSELISHNIKIEIYHSIARKMFAVITEKIEGKGIFYPTFCIKVDWQFEPYYDPNYPVCRIEIRRSHIKGQFEISYSEYHCNDVDLSSIKGILKCVRASLAYNMNQPGVEQYLHRMTFKDRMIGIARKFV